MPNTIPLPPSPRVAPSPPDAAQSPPSEGKPSTILQIQRGISATRNYTVMAVEEIIKPSIKTFIETCDTNPRVAAIVATPALLAFFVVATFLRVLPLTQMVIGYFVDCLLIVDSILSASALVLYSILTISVGVIFVVVGGLLSSFKLIIILLAMIPMAGMATGLLVAANSASKFIIDKLPKGNPENVSRTLKEIDWKAFVDGTTALGKNAVQGAKDATPALIAIRDVLSTLATAAYSALHTALTALNNQQSSPAPTSGPNSTTGEGEAVITEVDLTTGSSAVVPGGEQNFGAREDTGVLIDNHDECSGNLKRRTPFPNAGDDAELEK